MTEGLDRSDCELVSNVYDSRDVLVSITIVKWRLTKVSDKNGKEE